MYQISECPLRLTASNFHSDARGRGREQCRFQTIGRKPLAGSPASASLVPLVRRSVDCNPEATKILFGKVFLSLLMVSPVSAYALGMGGVDSTSAWTYSGWACNPSAPGYQNEVQARRDDGVFLGRVIADRSSKTPVPATCASPHQFHGFQLDIERKPEWVDGKVHEVILYSIDHNGNSTPLRTFPANFSSVSDGVNPPRNIGDIVGRDLNYVSLGWAGHIGVWDGSSVIEVLDERGYNKVYKNSWENFKSRSKAWDTVHPKYPGHMIKTCWINDCDVNQSRFAGMKVSAQQAVVYRATQVYMIGADYTITAGFTTAEPVMKDYNDPRWRRKAIRGKYRCDTFVYDAFRASTDIDNAGIFPYREIYGMDHSWRSKVSSLYGFTTMLPSKVMEKIRNF
ncbi:hypothetical protein [Pantoea sp. 18069]|uniref:hypothetical protein n=1 Tax=Pantoea sp. 18069 TaxID=2681415 RepID=UPI0013571888|nr:hypothetical protein [Pantoea sp. 18069]